MVMESVLKFKFHYIALCVSTIINTSASDYNLLFLELYVNKLIICTIICHQSIVCNRLLLEMSMLQKTFNKLSQH